MKKNVSVIIWVVAICVVLAAAYTFYSTGRPVSPAPAQPQQDISAGQVTQDKAATQAAGDSSPVVPDFTLKDLDGKSVKLSDYKGKIVILNFWAVWCKYCKQEMPDLNELNKTLVKDNEAVILAVDVQESKSTVENYLSANKIDLHVLLDQDGSLTQAFGITGFPTTFIVNKDGTLYTYIPGATNKETLQGILDKIKKGEPANSK
jgi:peroxiredoxin/predicted small secreted protein